MALAWQSTQGSSRESHQEQQELGLKTWLRSGNEAKLERGRTTAQLRKVMSGPR